MSGDHELPPGPGDTNAVAGNPWLFIFIVAAVIFLLGAGVYLQQRVGNGAKFTPSVTQLSLPAEACPAPETGQALVITVFPLEPDGKSRRAVCQIMAGRTI